MSQIKLDRMTDILLPSAAQPGWIAEWMIALSLVFIVLLILLIIYYQQPLRRLQRQLLHKQVTPRAAAHQLALLLDKKSLKNQSKILVQLEKMRFQRCAPQADELLKLIKNL